MLSQVLGLGERPPARPADVGAGTGVSGAVGAQGGGGNETVAAERATKRAIAQVDTLVTSEVVEAVVAARTRLAAEGTVGRRHDAPFGPVVAAVAVAAAAAVPGESVGFPERFPALPAAVLGPVGEPVAGESARLAENLAAIPALEGRAPVELRVLAAALPVGEERAAGGAAEAAATVAGGGAGQRVATVGAADGRVGGAVRAQERGGGETVAAERATEGAVSQVNTLVSAEVV